MKAPFCAAAAVAFLLAHAASAEPPPAEAYGRRPAIFDAAISPDGSKVAVALTEPDGQQAFNIVSLDDSRSIFATRVSEARRDAEQTTLRGVGWADDAHVVYTLSATFAAQRVLPSNVFTPGRRRLDYWRTGIADLERREQYLVTIGADEYAWGRGNLASLMAPVEGDAGAGRLIAATGPFREDVLAVYRVHLETGRGSLRTRGVRDTLDFVLDRRGEPIVRVDADARTNRWRLLDVSENAPRLIVEQVSETGAPLAIAGLLPDGRLAGVDRIDDRGRQVLFAMDRATGATTALIEHERYDVAAPIFDPWTHEIVGAAIVEEYSQQRFLEPDLADALARLRALDPGAIVQLLSWSRDRTKFVVYFEQATDAGGYYCV